MRIRMLGIFGTILLFAIPELIAASNCPPAPIPKNPSPVGPVVCIASAQDVTLDLNQSWSTRVTLTGGQRYWYGASMCSRGRRLFAEVLDGSGHVLKSAGGVEARFCFIAPTTGTYTIRHTITELNGRFTYAVTSSCLSESRCAPNEY